MVDRKWSAGETVALVEAWRSLYNRRRGGKYDVWVPATQRSRARRAGALVYADWRAVATAVNSFRAEINHNPIRTHKQCKRRVELLKSQFGHEQLATPSWLGFLPQSNNTSGGRRHSSLRVPAAAAMEAHGGDECGRGAAGGQAHGGSAVAAGCSAAAKVKGVPVGAATEDASDGVAAEVKGVPVGAATENASDGVTVEMEGGGATRTAPEDALGCGTTSADPSSGPMDRFTAATATDLLGGPIPKKRRTGASTSADAGDRRAPPAGGLAATAAEMAAALSEVVAAESNDVAVVASLLKETTALYKEVTTKRIELQAQMVAALVAATGGVAPSMPVMGV